MKYKKVLSILIPVIIILAAVTSAVGIFSNQGPGTYQYESIRGEEVTIYGRGIYRHMSAEVAVQGIAQDYVTLFLAVPLLLISFYFTGRGSVKARYFTAGTLGYLLVTYLFYLVMAMYNALFLLYAALLGTTFFALSLTLFSFDMRDISNYFKKNIPLKSAGNFLIFNAVVIGFLWLSTVVSPLLEGSIFPQELEHYTTLIVQGMDLGLLLPLAVISGLLLKRKKRMGLLLGPVYMIFLSFLMTALTAKLIAMGINGYEIIPAIIVIPLFAAAAIVFSYLILKGIKKEKAKKN